MPVLRIHGCCALRSREHCHPVFFGHQFFFVANWRWAKIKQIRYVFHSKQLLQLHSRFVLSLFFSSLRPPQPHGLPVSQPGFLGIHKGCGSVYCWNAQAGMSAPLRDAGLRPLTRPNPFKHKQRITLIHFVNFVLSCLISCSVLSPWVGSQLDCFLYSLEFPDSHQKLTPNSPTLPLP